MRTRSSATTPGSASPHRVELLVVIGVAIVVVIVAGIAAALAGRQSDSAGAGAPTARVDPSPTTAAIAPTLTAIATEFAAYPPDKATAAAQEVLAQATAIANPAKPTKPTVPATPTPDAATPAMPESGILDIHQSAASIRGYFVSNVWQAPIGDGATYLQVSAGASKGQDSTPTDDGIIAIAVLQRDDTGAYVAADDLRVYPSPVRSGALRIIAVDGDLVTLESTGGDQVIFNLATRTFQ